LNCNAISQAEYRNNIYRSHNTLLHQNCFPHKAS